MSFQTFQLSEMSGYNTRSKAKLIKKEEKKEDKKEKAEKKEAVVVINLQKILENVIKKNKEKSIDSDDEDSDDEDSDDEDSEDEEDWDEWEDDETIEKINNSQFSQEVKDMLIEKYKNADDFDKVQNWINTVLKIPVGKLADMPITMKNTNEDIVKYFEEAKEKLDKAVYGMENVKEELLSYIAQIITSQQQCNPRVLALQSVAGCGKTSIIRKGFAEVLARPIKHISMGGITDSSTFFGFDYTYYGSKCGIIIQAIIDAGVMNPIIYLDELDKISDTAQGQDVANFLVHLTDPEQQQTFKDKYIGFDIDLSKVMFVFSYNDDNLINPILLDRLNVIRVKPYSFNDKKVIATKYLLPEACKNIGFDLSDIDMDEYAMNYIIRNYDQKGGVRDIKRAMETIIMRLNTIKITGNKIKLSYSINPEVIETEEVIVKNVSNRKRLKKQETVKKLKFKITENNVRKITSSDKEDNTSYKMMFL
jgi:ATP-dependent Lon protease